MKKSLHFKDEETSVQSCTDTLMTVLPGPGCRRISEWLVSEWGRSTPLRVVCGSLNSVREDSRFFYFFLFEVTFLVHLYISSCILLPPKRDIGTPEPILKSLALLAMATICLISENKQREVEKKGGGGQRKKMAVKDKFVRVEERFSFFLSSA